MPQLNAPATARETCGNIGEEAKEACFASAAFARSPVDRRHFIGAGAALAASAALRVPPARAGALERVRPGMPGWPLATEWAALNDATHGRLSRVTPVAVNPADAQKLLSNPFYIADQVALTQSAGWLDAWRSSLSAYVGWLRAPPT